jgi:predicted NUDIX family phosphoesterase
VDAQDAPATFDPSTTLRRAWLRELGEELNAHEGVQLTDIRLHGLVYEDLSAIGRVHLGVVFVARWCSPKPPQPPEGEALHALGFMPLGRIATDTRFELWSRLVAQHLLTSPVLPKTPIYSQNGVM